MTCSLFLSSYFSMGFSSHRVYKQWLLFFLIHRMKAHSLPPIYRFSKQNGNVRTTWIFFLQNTKNTAVDYASMFSHRSTVDVSHHLKECFCLPRVSLWLMAVTVRTETVRPPLHATRSISPPSWERSLRPGSSPSGKGGVDKAWHSASLTTVM